MMRTPKLLFKRISCAQNVRFKVSKALATSCLVGGGLGAGEAFALDVPENANLYTYLSNATAEAHDFSLLGDVTLGSTFTINNARYLNIIIEGNGHSIVRTSQNNDFWVHLPNTNLTIRNAIITTSATGGTSWGAVSIDTNRTNVTLNLDGTTFRNNIGASGAYSGGLTVFANGAVANGNIRFEGNHSNGGAGAVSVAYDNNASLQFTGNVDFVGNYTSQRSGAVAANNNSTLVFDKQVNFTENYAGQRGGALWLDTNANVTFKDRTVFTGNYAGHRGGAINIQHGNSHVVFEENVTFAGNYVRGNNSDAPRGGAVSIGHETGSTLPQFTAEARAEFSDNYVWGEGVRNGYGGAIALTSADNATGTGNLNANHIYGIAIEQGVFTDNYAYSATGSGYGGAVYSQSYQSVVSFGSGSEFTDNAASTLGGAIYFNQGTINLSGDVTFSGNRHGVAFSTAGNVLQADMDSGSANAIYFSSVSNVAHTATLNMTTGRGETIDFSDPIQSAAARSVIVRHSGEGLVRFSGHNSDILAQTDISGGTFELGAGASYGRAGTPATSYFNLTPGATLVGGANSTLRASIFTIDGRIESTTGVFYLEGGDINLSESSVFAINIFNAENYSSIDAGGNALNLNNATLEVTATNYVPSQQISDTFTIVANLAEEPITFFAQGDSIRINGAEFKILYNANSIVLQQMTIPEPSTYALFLAIGCIGFAWSRRQRKKDEVLASAA